MSLNYIVTLCILSTLYVWLIVCLICVVYCAQLTHARYLHYSDNAVTYIILYPCSLFYFYVLLIYLV